MTELAFWLFGLLVCCDPAADASGEVLDVGVAELGSGVSSTLVSVAAWATTIGDDESVFVLGEHFGELGFFSGEVDRRGDVAAVFVGLRAVDVDDGDLFGIDGFFEFFDADVFVFTGKSGGRSDERGCEQCD